MTDFSPDCPDPPPEILKEAARALYQKAVQAARKHVAERKLPLEAIRTVFEDAIDSASDREAAIIIFALVDDLATEFYREKLTGTIPGGIEQNFLRGNGMLATAHNKIMLLAGLEWISARTYKELRLIRRIRNHFAHHVESKNCTDHPVCDYIDNMRPTETQAVASFKTIPFAAQTYMPEPIIRDIVRGVLIKAFPLRSKFILRSCIAIGEMTKQLAVTQASLTYQVVPESILGANFDSLPENLKDLYRTISRLTYITIREGVLKGFSDHVDRTTKGN